jgi:hypothetical protein
MRNYQLSAIHCQAQMSLLTDATVMNEHFSHLLFITAMMCQKDSAFWICWPHSRVGISSTCQFLKNNFVCSYLLHFRIFIYMLIVNYKILIVALGTEIAQLIK